MPGMCKMINTNYDSGSIIHRQVLALDIIKKLEECGFKEDSKPGNAHPRLSGERVFSRLIPNTHIDVKVYTTVRDMEVRGSGQDAIRVCAVYRARDGNHRGVGKSKRVHRTGNIHDIVHRMYSRMREVWKAASTGVKCSKCDAPLFTAKSGKLVCSEICWINPQHKA